MGCRFPLKLLCINTASICVQVSVIYFRCGYSPDQYPSEKEWDARLLMERSKAIKSPSIHYHLAGTKKVQQQLALPGVLEKYIKDPKKVKEIRGIFTGLYALDKVPNRARSMTSRINRSVFRAIMARGPSSWPCRPPTGLS